jgi:hypothetical protein
LGISVEFDFERPVSVGNKVFLGVTVKKLASSGGPTPVTLEVSPFMRDVEHVMYIAPVTNFRPIHLALETDDDEERARHDIVMEPITVAWNNRTIIAPGRTGGVTLSALSNQGQKDDDFELVSNGDEIGKFLIIGSK